MTRRSERPGMVLRAGNRAGHESHLSICTGITLHSLSSLERETMTKVPILSYKYFLPPNDGQGRHA